MKLVVSLCVCRSPCSPDVWTRFQRRFGNPPAHARSAPNPSPQSTLPTVRRPTSRLLHRFSSPNRHLRRLVSRAWTTLHWPSAIRLPGAPPLPNPLLPLPDDTERAHVLYFLAASLTQTPSHFSLCSSSFTPRSKPPPFCCSPESSPPVNSPSTVDSKPIAHARSFLSATRSRPGSSLVKSEPPPSRASSSPTRHRARRRPPPPLQRPHRRAPPSEHLRRRATLQ